MKFGHWLGLIGLAVVVLLLWHLREAVILIFAAVVLAMALCTLIGSVRRRLNCSRSLALAISLLILMVVALVVGFAVIPPFASQFSVLMEKLPQAASASLQLLEQALAVVSQMLYGSSDGGLDWLQRQFSGTIQFPSLLAGGLGGGALRLVNVAGDIGAAVLQTLFVVAVALMLAVQPLAYREAMLRLVPSFYRRRARRILELCGNALSAWMVGVLISCLCVGGLTAVGLSLLGVKLVAANAVLAGLLNVIPNVGPTLSTIFPMAVALLEEPWKALAVLLLYIVVQHLESYLITPSVMHHQLQLLPGLTLVAQLVFTVLFGPLGLLLALPLAVCLQVILRELLIHDILDPWKQRRRAL